MIENFSIGIDISSGKKFSEKPFKDNESFYKKNFSKEEIEYCLRFKNNSEKFAGRFALKEAVIKSIKEQIAFSKIETSYLDSKILIKILDSEKNYKFNASLSHEDELAIAVVISEKIKYVFSLLFYLILPVSNKKSDSLIPVKRLQGQIFYLGNF